MSKELQQGTPEWYEARRGRITASMVGAILGDSPWTSPNGALRDMVADMNGGNQKDGPAMRYGREHEDEAAAVYAFLYGEGQEISETGFWADEWEGVPVGASPDRLVGEEGLVEIKCPYSLREDESPEFKSIHDQPHYWHQVQMQLAITGRKWCDFFQWTRQSHRCERVYPDPDWQIEIMKELESFYNAFQAKMAEQQQGGPADKLAHSGTWYAHSEGYRLASITEAAAKADKEAHRKALIDLMERSHVDECRGGGIKVQKISRAGSIDYRLMAQDNLPNLKEIEEEYRKAPTESWRIDVESER